MKFKVSCPNKHINGKITLEGSKSISNRVLIIRALSGRSFDIHNLAKAKDTETLNQSLQNIKNKIDVGPAGTTFRFLTTFLSQKKGDFELSGSKRMHERPIGALVDALRSIGADITYLEQNGYPPLRIKGTTELGKHNNKINIAANVSSQFISALLLIAPNLPHGLDIILEGKVASRPYIQMTLDIMHYFGAKCNWEGNRIQVKPGKYIDKSFYVESDWSAASYFFEIAILSDSCDLQIEGLQKESMQGDSAIRDIAAEFGVSSSFEKNILHLTKSADAGSGIAFFEYDFEEVPDLAQTVLTFCAAKNIKGLFTGLESLRIKETDRIEALKTELKKMNSIIFQVPKEMISKAEKPHYILEGEPKLLKDTCFQTYDDHRMGMCLAPLALVNPVEISDPNVVESLFLHIGKNLSQSVLM